MSERQTRSSRHLQPSHNKKLDKLLNVLIGIVFILIVITAIYVFKWQDDSEETVKEDPVQEQKNDDATQEHPKEEDVEADEEVSKEEPKEEEPKEESGQSEQDTVVETTSDDPIVDRAVTDNSWKPTPTTQTGEHVSSYNVKSVDWAEKIATITAATGIANDNMIIWRLQNNGGADTAIATVSTKDKAEMYRVSMEWVNNEGWLPVKLEQLNTLEGAY
ncbi:YrrS family protein [Lysinibacillus sp. NPDC048646]|uniref:YrrS family protein n=1 Tax=Lysinibacillus sp. NPDC048646 TaxID=3390574 RepID=UPI003D060D45